MQADGTYFIDANGALFKHILHYLQNGVFPLLYDDVKGVDHVLDLSLLVFPSQSWYAAVGGDKTVTSLEIPS